MLRAHAFRMAKQRCVPLCVKNPVRKYKQSTRCVLCSEHLRHVATGALLAAVRLRVPVSVHPTLAF